MTATISENTKSFSCPLCGKSFQSRTRVVWLRTYSLEGTDTYDYSHMDPTKPDQYQELPEILQLDKERPKNGHVIHEECMTKAMSVLKKLMDKESE